MTIGESRDSQLEKRIPGAGEFTSANYIDRGPVVKRCVARVWHDSGPGTGLLLPDNWFLTNHHVLPNIEKAKESVAQFNYERQADGMFAEMKQFQFNPEAGFHTSPVIDGDDWTVVKLMGDANAEFGAIRLEVIGPGVCESVSIIQHPDAGPRQVAEGPIVEIIDTESRRIRYQANTLPGSSGSPVFNRRWQVIALHHSSSTSRNKETGEAFECNEGIHIAALLEGLRKVGVWPHRESTDVLSSRRAVMVGSAPQFPASPVPVARDGFVNCSPVFTAFEQILTVNASKRILLIQGYGNQGKSTLLSKFYLHTRDLLELKNAARVEFKQAGLSPESQVAAIARTLGVSVRDEGNIDDRVAALLEACAGRPVVIFFDAFEHAELQHRHWVDRILERCLDDANLRCVVAGRKVPMHKNQPWANLVYATECDALKDKDAIIAHIQSKGYQVNPDIIVGFVTSFVGLRERAISTGNHDHVYSSQVLLEELESFCVGGAKTA